MKYFEVKIFCMLSRIWYFSLQKRGSQKGVVDLKKVKVIEKVDDSTFEKPSFQVS